MSRITVTARVGADGVLRLPLGAEGANCEVRVTIETTADLRTESPQEYSDFLSETTGAWQGDFLSITDAKNTGNDFLSPEQVSRTLAAMDQMESMDMSDEELIAWETERKARRELEKGQFVEKGAEL